MAFQLHPRLAADSLPVAALEQSDVRLMLDARFPWALVVPRIADARELHHLPRAVRHAVWDEVMAVCTALETMTRAAKMNVGALGNLVPQLHVHVVARHPDDAAWPGPVWGAGSAEPYRGESGLMRRQRLIDDLRTALSAL